MKHSFKRLLAALFLFVLGVAACDSPTAGGGPKPAEQAQIGFSLDLSGLPVQTLVVQVTAPDITTPLVFNIPISNGIATGNIAVPAGRNRLITVRAFDAQGTITHEGSATVDQVRAGNNMAVVIHLIPRAANVPITVYMGSLVVIATRATPVPAGGDRVGDTIRAHGQVTLPGGTPLPGAVVRWATSNPAIASVDSTGLVRALLAGSVDIVATYGGYGDSLRFVFTAGADADSTAPTLAGVNATPDSVTMGSTPATVNVSFAVTADDAGRGFYSTSVVVQSPDGATTRQCSASAAPAPGRATRTCAVTLPRTGPGGRWTVRELTVADSAGNVRSYTGAQLAAAGFDSGVTMTGTAPDTEAPVLVSTDFRLTGTAIEDSAWYDVATLRIEATDVGSGIERIDFTAGDEHGGYSLNGSTTGSGSSGFTWQQVGPTTWEMDVGLDGTAPNNAWYRVNSIKLTDRAGNVLEFNAAQLESRGMRAGFFLQR